MHYWVLRSLLLIGFCLLLGLWSCGEVTVNYPGCETCPERCLHDDKGRGRCVNCLRDSHCREGDSSTKRCNADNRCVCGSDADCSERQVCAGNKGCVECQSDADCKSRDSHPTCVENECRPCRPDETQTCGAKEACKQGSQKCKRNGSWGPCEGEIICKEGERCEGQACVSDCPKAPPCALDDKKCTTDAKALPGKYQRCIKDERGCPSWSTATTSCPAQSICSKGQCLPYTCPPAPCQEKQSRCASATAMETCARDAFGCLAWMAQTPCPSGLACSSALGRCAPCTPKQQMPCYSGAPGTEGKGLCKAGIKACKDDGSGFGPCLMEVVPTQEACNGKDDDCDGKVDEELKAPLCGNQKGTCKGATQTCTGKDGWLSPCGAADYMRHSADHEATETLCDGKDNDCDGQIDNGLKAPACANQKGVCKGAAQRCAGAKGWSACVAADYSAHSSDYAAQDTCDGKDNDCNGIIDGQNRSCYSGPQGSAGQGACKAGTQTCSVGVWGACTGEVLPQSSDICGNGKDDDCNGAVDENCPWAKAISGGSAIAVAVGDKGDVYITGSYTGTLRLGSRSLTAKGADDIYVASYTAAGALRWALSAGGSGDDAGLEIAVDGKGNAYVTGRFSGTASFGTASLTSKGSADIFVAQISAAGAFRWATSAGGTQLDQAHGVALDSAGNIYITGDFAGQAQFGSASLSKTPNGKADIFVAKLDATGKWGWVQSFGSADNDSGRALAVSQNKHLYITGHYRGSMKIGSQTYTSQALSEVFLLKLDLSGGLVWLLSGQGKGANFGNRLAVDASGNAFLVGSYGSQFQLGARSLNSHSTFATSPNLFIAMIDSTAKTRWLSSANSNAGFARGVGIDGQGRVYLAGSFTKTNNFTVATLSSKGSYDVFVARVNATNGGFDWVTSAGSPFLDRGLDLAVAPTGQLHVVGLLGGTASFGSTQLTTAGQFLWKIPKP